MPLSGSTVLITGAAGGLGSALAMACAKAGANMVLLDKNRRGLTALSDRITGLELEAPGLYPLDLAGAGIDEFDELVRTIAEEYGGLDALVHCAAEFPGLQPLDQVGPHEWLHAMQVNVNAPWLLSCACLPLLKKSPGAHLVFLLDDLDTVTDAYWGAYGTGKAALTGLVRQFDAALSGTGVTVRGILPGPMRTGLRARVYHAENPMDQPDPAEAAAKVAAMLAGDASPSGPIVDLIP